MTECNEQSGNQQSAIPAVRADSARHRELLRDQRADRDELRGEQVSAAIEGVAMKTQEAEATFPAAALRARGLSKVYREGASRFRALSNVSLDIHSGQLTLLMGPSGSGKTTLLSILGCILRATEGELELLGRDVASLSEKELPRVRRDSIGFVFQGFNLFPALSAAENVALALDVRGIRGQRARERSERLLEEVGLQDRMRAFPADLSGGQKQRVAIARALAGDPPILLADEPTAALDSSSGRTVIELLQRLAHQHGRAVVMVTHDPRVLSYGDRILHLEDGRLSREEFSTPTKTSVASAASVLSTHSSESQSVEV